MVSMNKYFYTRIFNTLEEAEFVIKENPDFKIVLINEIIVVIDIQTYEEINQ
jgi:hypothetical protein